MNINGLLKVAEKNKSIPTQKRFSLDFSPPRKLPKTQVNPAAIKALLEKKERERRDERANLISKAVESTKRDEVNYKDHNGLRKAEQERTEKCKKQWQKVQKDRRDFIEHMNNSADRRDKNKQARDAKEVISSIKAKEQSKDKRKRKYEPFVGSTETSKKPKYTPTVAPKVADINELMKIAQKNAENKAFGTLVNPLRELERKQPSAPEERLLTQAEKKKLAEQEAASKRRGLASIPRIPKVGQNSESHKPSKHKKSEVDCRNESSKSSRDKPKHRNYTSSNGNHTSNGAGGSSSNSKEKYEKPRDKKPSSSEKDRKHMSDKNDKPKTSHNGSSSSKTNGLSKTANTTALPIARKTHSAGSNGNLGKPQNGNVAVQSMSSSAKEKLREEMARKLAQLQKERQAEEEEERRKRIQAKKARMAQEQLLKKKLRALQQTSAKVESEQEDDYDEDLDEYEDDFIDDAPIDDPYRNGYSQHIKEIFKYDKSKFKNMDDDDIEESSFTRCMAEEARSARLGRQEDLEDIRKEAEENQKKNNRSKLKELAEKLKQKKKLTLCPV